MVASRLIVNRPVCAAAGPYFAYLIVLPVAGSHIQVLIDGLAVVHLTTAVIYPLAVLSSYSFPFDLFSSKYIPVEISLNAIHLSLGYTPAARLFLFFS